MAYNNEKAAYESLSSEENIKSCTNKNKLSSAINYARSKGIQTENDEQIFDSLIARRQKLLSNERRTRRGGRRKHRKHRKHHTRRH